MEEEQQGRAQKQADSSALRAAGLWQADPGLSGHVGDAAHESAHKAAAGQDLRQGRDSGARQQLRVPGGCLCFAEIHADCRTPVGWKVGSGPATPSTATRCSRRRARGLIRRSATARMPCRCVCPPRRPAGSRGCSAHRRRMRLGPLWGFVHCCMFANSCTGSAQQWDAACAGSYLWGPCQRACTRSIGHGAGSRCW